MTAGQRLIRDVARFAFALLGLLLFAAVIGWLHTFVASWVWFLALCVVGGLLAFVIEGRQ